MAWPSVSIVIPSLNMGAFLERTLLSILKQDYPAPVQIIVADGGSTDQTASVLARYPQVVSWSKPDGGIVDAILTGMRVATGEVLAIQGCDDFYLEDAFRSTLAELTAHPDLDIITGCDIYLRSDGVTFSCSQLDSHEISPLSLMMRRVIPIHAAFFRRRVWDRLQFRNLGDARAKTGGNVGNVGVDIDFWYRALHFFKGRFIPRHVAAYQFHPAQMTSNSRHWFTNMTGVVEACEADPVYSRIHRFSEIEKENLYIRWKIRQDELDGHSAQVASLVEQVMSDARYTEETRDFLRLHGFAAKKPKATNAPLHPNHRVPDFKWMFADVRGKKVA